MAASEELIIDNYINTDRDNVYMLIPFMEYLKQYSIIEALPLNSIFRYFETMPL